MTTLREHQFEHWYKLTHWMSPELTKRDDGSYVHHVVQSMYIAYLAGYNRSAKDRKEELRKHTAPPQRKPLTEEEIYEMYNEPRSDAEMVEFARAVEAAHGIGGKDGQV